MPERLVYEHTFEGLFVRGLAGRISPAVKERLRRAGLDLERKLLPAYPFETWVRCVAIVAESLYPGEPEEVSYRLLGERMVDGYRDTFTGRMMFRVLQLLSPRRLAARTEQNFRSGNNYTEVRQTDEGLSEVELWVNEPGPTRYIVQGAMLATLRASRPGDEGVGVDVLDFTAEGVSLRVSWTGEP
ncbi:DUF2378 family protein [Archangium lansingense]|uniref:DUF2378 family protein n=1 Tax=Archangium lansingense TaxID=2995310 RepID=A0ABT3ZXS1_9BACT|nr:DUF2378 family protein [Archangium lansinium]MCY1073881.1 DUF2378 family protein [Archangium lansinium]